MASNKHSAITLFWASGENIQPTKHMLFKKKIATKCKTKSVPFEFSTDPSNTVPSLLTSTEMLKPKNTFENNLTSKCAALKLKEECVPNIDSSGNSSSNNINPPTKLRMTIKNKKVVYTSVDEDDQSKNVQESMCNISTNTKEYITLESTSNNKKNTKSEVKLLNHEVHDVIVKIFPFYTTDLLVHSPIPNIHLLKSNELMKFQRNILKIEQHNVISTNIQQYLWNYILFGLNISIVSSSYDDSYILPMCHFALQKTTLENNNCSSTLQNRSKKESFILIIVKDDERCVHIVKKIQKFLENIQILNRPTVSLELNELSTQHIIVTTPAKLMIQIQRYPQSLLSICHIVIDNGSYTLKNCHSEMCNALDFFDKSVIQRSSHKGLQIIVVSKCWSVDIKNLLEKLAAPPCICLHDSLQMAVYGNVEFKKKKLDSKIINFFVEDILKSYYTHKKTIVFWKDNNIEEFGNYLRYKGFEVAHADSKTKKGILKDAERQWVTASYGSYNVLVCSDEILDQLSDVDDAELIIHCTFPMDSAMLYQRFSVFRKNIIYPFSNQQSDGKCKSYFLLSEKRHEDMFYKIISMWTASRNQSFYI